MREDRLGDATINDGLREAGDFVAGYTCIVDTPKQECREGDDESDCAACVLSV